MKNWLIIGCMLLATASFGQKTSTVQDIITARESLTINGKKITGIKNDSTSKYGDSTKLITEKAAKAYSRSIAPKNILPISQTWINPGYANIFSADSFNVQPQLFRHNDTTYLYMEHGDCTGHPCDFNIIVSYTTDMKTWTPSRTILLPTGNPGDPDKHYVADPTVLYIPWAEHKFHMWFDMTPAPNSYSTIGHAYADHPLGPWIKQATGGVSDIVINTTSAFNGYANLTVHAPEAILDGNTVKIFASVQGSGHLLFDAMLFTANDALGLGTSFEPIAIVTNDNTVTSPYSDRLQNPIMHNGVLYSTIITDSLTINKASYFVTSTDGGLSWNQIGRDTLGLGSFLLDGDTLWACSQRWNSPSLINQPTKMYYLNLKTATGVAVPPLRNTITNTKLPISLNAYKWMGLHGDAGFERVSSNKLSTGALDMGGPLNVVGDVRISGSVGVGINPPLAKFHINGADFTAVLGVSGTTSGFRIYPTPSDGVLLQGVDNTLFGAYGKVTLGGTTLQLQSGGANDVMTLSPSLNVGIGTTTPSQKLEVNGNVLAAAYNIPSDQRWKEKFTPINNALGLINKLHAQSYEYKKIQGKNFNKGKQFGLVAQEVEKVLPEIVTTDSAGYHGLNYTAIIPILIAAMQEQQKQIDSLKVRLNGNNLIYKIENKDRRFGGSPDVWKAGVYITDNYVTRFWLFTESDIAKMNDRADKNKSDSKK